MAEQEQRKEAGSADKEQEQFEALVASKDNPRSLRQVLPGLYADPILQAAWEGWQARAEAAESENARLREELRQIRLLARWDGPDAAPKRMHEIWVKLGAILDDGAALIGGKNGT